MRTSLLGFGRVLGWSAGWAVVGCGASPDGDASDIVQSSAGELRGEENQGRQLVGDALGSPDRDGVHRVLPPPTFAVQVSQGKLLMPSAPGDPTAVVGKPGFRAELFVGGTVDLRIDAAVPAETAPEASWDIDRRFVAPTERYWANLPAGSTWLYKVSAFVGQKWVDFCAPYVTTNAPGKSSIYAVPIAEYFQENGSMTPTATDGAFTFACLSGAEAKCYKWRYLPWLSPARRTKHWACTRAARGDYCGDGRWHTKNDTRIDIYDRDKTDPSSTGVRIEDAADATNPLTFEAGWHTAGAVCINHWRFDHLAPDGIFCPSLVNPWEDPRTKQPNFCDSYTEARHLLTVTHPVLIGLDSRQAP